VPTGRGRTLKAALQVLIYTNQLRGQPIYSGSTKSSWTFIGPPTTSLLVGCFLKFLESHLQRWLNNTRQHLYCNLCNFTWRPILEFTWTTSAVNRCCAFPIELSTLFINPTNCPIKLHAIIKWSINPQLLSLHSYTMLHLDTMFRVWCKFEDEDEAKQNYLPPECGQLIDETDPDECSHWTFRHRFLVCLVQHSQSA
jgi:hypothetical protein